MGGETSLSNSGVFRSAEIIATVYENGTDSCEAVSS